jgi:hypothetical protein
MVMNAYTAELFPTELRGDAFAWAAAATAADPTMAQRQKEAAEVPPRPPEARAGEPFPDDVFDRLETAQAD